MSNDYFNDPNGGTYQTGSTHPRKSRSGLVAFLLVCVIILLGAVALLGAMNIRLFRQLNGEGTGETLDISLEGGPTLASVGQQLSETDPDQEEITPIEIATTPTSAGNYQRDEGLSLQEIYAGTIDSVVSITCAVSGGTSSGTGVLISADGYIVTNCHVVENAHRIQVLLRDDTLLEAQLVGADPVSDLAVLLVEGEDLPYAQLGDSSALQVGDAVVAIGDPLGTQLRGTMTNGIISAINRDVNVNGRTMSLIQTNAALNSGNSGGPLINCYGQVIGINTMKMGDGFSVAGVEGLGFAIPSNTVAEVVNQLISQGYVSGRPYMGIYGEDVSEFYQVYYGLPQGMYITQVDDGSPAAGAGIHAGDILLTAGNSHIHSVSDYESVLYSAKPGDSLTVIIYRSGRQYTTTITVGEVRN